MTQISVPSLSLGNGATIPQIGLGTSPLNDEQVTDAIVTATELGYRHFDTAVKYGNEHGVGEGIRQSGIPRDELFITTKLDGAYQGNDKALAGIDQSLQRLGLERVDLLLIHWPLPERDEYISTWKTFEKIVEQGKAVSIGVSSFKPAHLDRLFAEASIAPVVNQLQLSPDIVREEQRAYNAAHGIVTESWSPLGGGSELLGEPVLGEIGARYGKTAAQVVLRWHIELGLVAIPRSGNPERMAQNIDVFDFSLTPEDMEQIASLSKGPDAGVDSDRSGH